MHGVRFIGILVVWFMILVGGTMILGTLLEPPEPIFADLQSLMAREAAAEAAWVRAAALIHLGLLALFTLRLPEVGYRFRDVLFLLIPYYGLYFFCKILWRVTARPKYWPARPDPAPVEAQPRYFT